MRRHGCTQRSAFTSSVTRVAWAGSCCHAVAMTSGIGKTTPAQSVPGGEGEGALQLKTHVLLCKTHFGVLP